MKIQKIYSQASPGQVWEVCICDEEIEVGLNRDNLRAIKLDDFKVFVFSEMSATEADKLFEHMP